MALSFEAAMDVANGVCEFGWTGRGYMVSMVLGSTARLRIMRWRADWWRFTGLRFAMRVTMGLSG